MSAKRKPPKRSRASGRDSDSPEQMFASKLNALLEVASGHFRAGCVDDAIEFLEAAVELCEENPAFALKRIEGLGTNLQKVVAACVANALSKRVSHARLTELLRRIEALHRAMIH